MVLFVFFIISAAASVVYAILSAGVNGPADIWKPLLLCLGGVIGLVLVYLLIAAVVSLFMMRQPAPYAICPITGIAIFDGLETKATSYFHRFASMNMGS